ncbi:hypothetical protein GPJ56_009668 [Histomonas meleagridis]|uniref:uncharacterized protein n=1 Tax=Histomonas meleagridis TaxID=135588 RepID=UPI0035597655|nr:hypothetical protein GPJ56_009668 [Histomonas meleagridis]KAH0804407.1 hypothetical protein GO595_003237 [Histomonas meleagridis]
MERKIQPEEIRAALISQSGDIYNMGDVIRFLCQKNLYKHVGARFLCWMIMINKLPPNRSFWVSKLYEMYQNYIEIREKNLNDLSISPLYLIPADARRVISGDLRRTYVWFCKLAEQVGIQEYYLNGAQIRAERILTFIYLENPNYSYTQGNDRFVWVSFLVCLFFASHGGLNCSFAEALSFYLAEFFIMHNKVAKNLQNLPYLQHRFSKMDSLLSIEEPEVFQYLNQSQHFALQYGMKWELTFFSDEHNAHELMLIWDNILARFDHYGKFLQCLAVAHIKQVPIPSHPDEMAMTIQQYKNWNVSKIISDAIEMMDYEEDNSQQYCKCYGRCINFMGHLFGCYKKRNSSLQW